MVTQEKVAKIVKFDEYAAAFSAVIDHLLHDRADQAEATLREFAQVSVSEVQRRGGIPLRQQAEVYARDSYTCRYCNRRTIANPVLRLIAALFPELFRYAEGWRTDATDIAFYIISTSCDHVVPRTRGGSADATNLATACWMCNAMKQNFLLSELGGWELKPRAASEWRGLTEFVAPLSSKIGLANDPYYRSWVVAVSNPVPAVADVVTRRDGL